MAMFQGISLPDPEESLFLPGPPSQEFSDDESLWHRVIRDLPDHPPPNNQQALFRRSAPSHHEDDYDDLNSLDDGLSRSSSGRQPPSSNFSAQSTPARSRSSRSRGGARTVLGDLSLDELELVPPSDPPEDPEPEELQSRSTSRRRHQTYSRRVPYAYPRPAQQQPQLSQAVYNSHAISSPVPEPQPRERSRSARSSPRQPPPQPIWSRIPTRPTVFRGDPDEDQDYAPEPQRQPVRRPDRRIRDSQEYVDDDEERHQSEQECDNNRRHHRRLRSESVAPDPDVEMMDAHDQLDDDYNYDEEGEPELFPEEVSFRAPLELTPGLIPHRLTRVSRRQARSASAPASHHPPRSLHLRRPSNQPSAPPHATPILSRRLTCHL